MNGRVDATARAIGNLSLLARTPLGSPGPASDPLPMAASPALGDPGWQNATLARSVVGVPPSGHRTRQFPLDEEAIWEYPAPKFADAASPEVEQR